MGDKKQMEARMKTVKQVLVVGACVLFVVLMILSGMGSSWLRMFAVVKPGDAVVVDYTLYDAAGNPILTTNQQLAAKEKIVYSNKRLSFIAGQNLTKSIYPVPIYTTSGDLTNQFALFMTEYEAIDQAVIGMKAGDLKRVQIPGSAAPKVWDAATIAKSGLDINNLSTGALLPLAMSDDPDAMAVNTSVAYLRVGTITSKTDEGIVVDVNYPAAEISVFSINANN